MSYSIKKGDAVIVIAGEDKGKSGQVDKVIKSDDGARVVVSGAGLKTEKHFVKPRSGREKGGIVEKERAIDISNVMIVCSTKKTAKTATKSKTATKKSAKKTDEESK